MNISAIKPNFQGNDIAANALVKMNDNQLRQLAWMQTESKYDDKKANRVTNGLFYAAPVAAGTGRAVLGSGKTKLFSKELTGIAGRLGGGLKMAAGFAAILGAVDLVGMGISKLVNKSDKLKKFKEEHSFLTIAGTVAAALGTIFLMHKGIGKLGGLRTPKFLQDATERVANSLNNSKFLGKIKTGILKIADKTPQSLKNIGATVLSYSPEALMIGGVLNTLSSSSCKINDFSKNYTELRNAQAELTKEKIAQLEFENDYLKQEPEISEELEVLEG